MGSFYLYRIGTICVFVIIRPYINEYGMIDSVSVNLSYSYMRAAFTSQRIPVQAMLCQLWRCWPSIETTLGEFSVSARVGFGVR